MDKFSHELNLIVKPTAKRLCLANGYPLHMDIFEIRRRNLLALLASMKERGIRLQKDQAQRLGVAPSFLSQLAAGKKMGEDVARKFEVEARKDHGWMDHPNWSDSADEAASESQSQSLILDVSMMAETIRALRKSAKLHHRLFTMETEEDVARFLRFYRVRQVLPDLETLDNVIEIEGWRDHAKETGASSDRRETSTSTTGNHRGRRARKGASRKG